MKKLLFLCIVIVSVGTQSQAQNPLVKQWDKRFGGTSDELLHTIIQTSDGGFVLGGFSRSGIGGDKTQDYWASGYADYWIIKTDSIGNKEWDKRFGGMADEYFYVLQQTSDRGFILGGTSASGIGGDKTESSRGGYDYWIVKTDSLGNKLWDKRFGGAGIDELYGLQQTSDGGFILGGFSYSGIGGDKTQPNWDATNNTYDYWIVKTDSLGNKEWDKRFGGTSYDPIYSLQQTSDGGYILGGYSFSGISGDVTQASRGGEDYWIVKTDSLGNKEWDKRFGGADHDAIYSLQQTSDGGYILGGYSSSDSSGDKTQSSQGGKDIWLVKTDSLGQKEWDKRFGGTNDETLTNVSQTPDGGYLIGGDSYSPISGDKTENNLGYEQTWVVKTDSLGNKEWDKTLLSNSGTSHDENGFAIRTRDGCYAIANYTIADTGGYKTQLSQGSSDYWIVKFCDSTLTTSVQVSAMEHEVSLYPNPFTNQLSLKGTKEKGEAVLYDVMGKEMLRQKTTEGETRINTEGLAAGVYFISYTEGEKRENIKVVKMN